MTPSPVGYNLLSKVSLHNWDNPLQRPPRGNLEDVTLSIQIAHFNRRSFFQGSLLIIIARGHIDSLGQLDGLWPLVRLDRSQINLDPKLITTGSKFYLLHGLGQRHRGRTLGQQGAAKGQIHNAPREEAENDGASPDCVFVHGVKKSALDKALF